jgi:hypothetical protein
MIAFVPFANGILSELMKSKSLESKASRLGLMVGSAGEISKYNYSPNYAVSGNTYPVKDTLKANGARWDGMARAWTFPTLQALEIAVNAIEEAK